jgi:hypothetical protein
MKTYMVTFGDKKFIRFDQFDRAVQFAEHMSKKYNSVSEVVNYDTNELVYAVDPKIDLDKKLRI